MFQLNEGRIGSFGQAVDTTLNNPGGVVGATTPWVWSIIWFDTQGNLMRLDNQIFPTYYVYEDKVLVGIYTQGQVEAFIALDQNS